MNRFCHIIAICRFIFVFKRLSRYWWETTLVDRRRKLVESRNPCAI